MGAATLGGISDSSSGQSKLLKSLTNQQFIDRTITVVARSLFSNKSLAKSVSFCVLGNPDKTGEDILSEDEDG